MRLRFRFFSDGAGGTADGWHLDDIALQGGGPGCLPCDAAHDVDFGYAPPTPQVGTVIAFTGTATGTLPIAYTWDFGDGGAASGITATHAYTAAGTYTITLTAQNCGGPAAAVHTVTVAPACEMVDITAVNPEVAGCTVTFTAGLSGTAPFTYLWDFGDGATSDLPAPSHTYTQTGTYSGTLAVWNCTDTGYDTLPFTVQVECAGPRRAVYLPVVHK